MEKPAIWIVYSINEDEDSPEVVFLDYFFSLFDAHNFIKECVKDLTHPLDMEFLVGEDEKEYYKEMSSPFKVAVL